MVAVVVEVVVWSSAVKVVWFGDAYADAGTGRLMAAEGAGGVVAQGRHQDNPCLSVP